MHAVTCRQCGIHLAEQGVNFDLIRWLSVSIKV
jgi:hypothetical protein